MKLPNSVHVYVKYEQYTVRKSGEEFILYNKRHLVLQDRDKFINEFWDTLFSTGE